MSNYCAAYLLLAMREAACCPGVQPALLHSCNFPVIGAPIGMVCSSTRHCLACPLLLTLLHCPAALPRLGHLLCNVLRPRAVLALTATATPVTRSCVRQLLAIPPEQQLVESPLRNNLRLQVLHCNGASKGGGIAARVVQMLTTGEDMRQGAR